MKVLGIVCSPRRRGNTEILVKEALASARESGAEVELVTFAGKTIAPCDGCDSCRTTHKCRIKDDMQEIYPKLLECDGIIFGTPVYMWTMSAQAKIIMDRTHVFVAGRMLRYKVAGVVVVGKRTGTTDAFGAFHNFFNIHRMISSSAGMPDPAEDASLPRGRGGGVIAFAGDKGSVRQDKQGMDEAMVLGKAIVRAIKQARAG